MSDLFEWPDPAEMSTKERIIYESESLFAAKGFTGTGIDEIARHTGITKSVIYYHFSNKDAILEAIFERYSNIGKQFKRRMGGEFVAEPGRFRELITRSLESVDVSKWSKIAAILLMESVKEGREGLIFSLWDDNIRNVYELFGDYMKEEGIAREPEKFRFFSFFLLFIPQLSYTVFEEKWSSYYDLDRRELRSWFIELFGRVFEQLIMPEVWDTEKMGTHEARQSPQPREREQPKQEEPSRQSAQPRQAKRRSE